MPFSVKSASSFHTSGETWMFKPYIAQINSINAPTYNATIFCNTSDLNIFVSFICAQASCAQAANSGAHSSIKSIMLRLYCIAEIKKLINKSACAKVNLFFCTAATHMPKAIPVSSNECQNIGKV